MKSSRKRDQKPEKSVPRELPQPAGEILLALTELVPDFVVLLDLDGYINYVSPAVERVTGYAPGDVIGSPFIRYVHRDDRKTAEATFAAVVASNTCLSFTGRCRRRNGSLVALEMRAKNYADIPELGGILLCARDETRQVELVQSLRKSAQAALELFEDAPCGYHSADAEGTFLRINNTELAWLQYTRKELVGRRKFYELLTAGSRSQYEERVADFKEQGEVLDAEIEVVRKDGSIFPALVRATAKFGRNHKFLEGRATVFDITERKHAELALLRVNRALRVASAGREAIIRAGSVPGLLQAICRIMVEIGGYRVTYVHAVEHDAKSSMRLVAQAGFDGGVMEKTHITWENPKSGTGMIGWAGRTGVPQVAQNIMTDPRLANWREIYANYGVQSLISCPIRKNGMTFATLSIFAGEPDAFDANEQGLICELAQDIEFGIDSLSQRQVSRKDLSLPEPDSKGKGDPLRKLSPREREVLKLVVEGGSSKKIAAQLGVSPSSVDTYRSRIMFKLHVENLPALVRSAIRHGVVDA